MQFSAALEKIHTDATQATGLDDFGTADYLEGLNRILDALNAASTLTDEGAPAALNLLTAALAERLRTQHAWRENPGYADVVITAPVVITGIPRTGTTALHRLLACDPQFQGVERWLSSNPMPRPARETWAQAPEFKACEAQVQAFLAAMPGFTDVHELDPQGVDECLELLKQDFVSNYFASMLGIPAYREWWLTADELPSYRRYADILRLIGLNDQDKRWLLKNPGHVWGIDHLFEVFPDAMVVQTHRNPVKTLPSVARVLEMPRSMYHGDNVDPAQIGPSEADLWRRAIDRTEIARRRHPDKFFDVKQSDLRQDPIGTVRGLYRQLGLELADEVERDMRRWLDEQPEQQRQAPDAPPERYGLTVKGIQDQFGDYIAKYEL
ncbi:sulfotransferase family protein [Mycolicibacterium anyangense]|jgi:hypothetical protein|uniref:Sulfotransferase family protein n=1 Tax=Mycolicibacterium anyangense TaxID=1431246 RepID=A0A6N4W7T4_9MYCO|nr:sulfotransferase [Mycolicibacterium anyangense]BBZ77099.1 sulfotransferase family protein [Mycolicibacterium anyangense]